MTRRGTRVNRWGVLGLWTVVAAVTLTLMGAIVAPQARAETYQSNEQGQLAITIDGSDAEVEGVGFEPLAPVEVEMTSTGTGEIIAQGTADADETGRAAFQFTLPVDLTQDLYIAVMSGATPDGGSLVLSVRVNLPDTDIGPDPVADTTQTPATTTPTTAATSETTGDTTDAGAGSEQGEASGSDTTEPSTTNDSESSPSSEAGSPGDSSTVDEDADEPDDTNADAAASDSGSSSGDGAIVAIAAVAICATLGGVALMVRRNRSA